MVCTHHVGGPEAVMPSSDCMQCNYVLWTCRLHCMRLTLPALFHRQLSSSVTELLRLCKAKVQDFTSLSKWCSSSHSWTLCSRWALADVTALKMCPAATGACAADMWAALYESDLHTDVCMCLCCKIYAHALQQDSSKPGYWLTSCFDYLMCFSGVLMPTKQLHAFGCC